MANRSLPRGYERCVLTMPCLDNPVDNDLERQARAIEQTARYVREYEKLVDADFLVLRSSAIFQSTNSGMHWDQLMSVAKDRILNGRRVWETTRTLRDKLRDVMKSIGSDHRQRQGREQSTDAVAYPSETGHRVGSPAYQPYESAPTQIPSPEDQIFCAQRLELFFNAVKHKPDCLIIFESLASGIDPRKRCKNDQKYLSERRYDTALTYIRRKIGVLPQ